MSKTWFSADHHFGHVNIIKYTNRPFTNVDEMDEALIENHNSVVGVHDTVYMLGDVTLGRFDKFESYITRLNGIINIVPGGHDHILLLDYELFSINSAKYKALDPLVTETFPNIIDSPHRIVIVLCHYALRVWDRWNYGSLHLYGHSHGNLPRKTNTMDVGVDCHGYYPVSLEQVLEELQWPGE